MKIKEIILILIEPQSQRIQNILETFGRRKHSRAANMTMPSKILKQRILHAQT